MPVSMKIGPRYRGSSSCNQYERAGAKAIPCPMRVPMST